MWYVLCDRERDKGQYLVLKLICFYVGRGAEQISRIFSVFVLLRHNSVVGYADSEESPKPLKLHAAFHIETMGLKKKKTQFYWFWKDHSIIPNAFHSKLWRKTEWNSVKLIQFFNPNRDKEKFEMSVIPSNGTFYILVFSSLLGFPQTSNRQLVS